MIYAPELLLPCYIAREHASPGATYYTSQASLACTCPRDITGSRHPPLGLWFGFFVIHCQSAVHSNKATYTLNHSEFYYFITGAQLEAGHTLDKRRKVAGAEPTMKSECITRQISEPTNRRSPRVAAMSLRTPLLALPRRLRKHLCNLQNDDRTCRMVKRIHKGDSPLLLPQQFRRYICRQSNLTRFSTPSARGVTQERVAWPGTVQGR